MFALLNRIRPLAPEPPPPEPLLCCVCKTGVCVNCGSCCGASACAEECGRFIFENKTTLRKALEAYVLLPESPPEPPAEVRTRKGRRAIAERSRALVKALKRRRGA